MILNRILNNLRVDIKNINLKRHSSVVAATALTEKAKLLQESALDEECILVDVNDRPLGSSSKRDCHRVLNGNQLKLHRAFSVFLFNSAGDMLLQRRSKHKITFPDCYTNACCSHPLHEIEGEREELNAIGIRRAAQRRLNYELGIPLNQVRPENFHYLTRIHYQDFGDGTWGEHEIDYILFLQKDVDLKPNSSEVSEIKYIKKSEMDKIFSTLDAPLTPWFNLILKYRLRLWWNNLHRLNMFEVLHTIQKFEK